MDSFKQICDYIHQLYRTEDFVPLSVPVFCGNEKKYLEECIDSTFVSSVGPFVDLFEKRIAEYTQSRKAVVCVNGTNALHLALLLVDTRQEDEVSVISVPILYSSMWTKTRSGSLPLRSGPG